MAQDTAGRRPVCRQTRPCQTAFGLIVVGAVSFNESDKGDFHFFYRAETDCNEFIIYYVVPMQNFGVM